MARIAGVDIPRDKRIEVSLTYIYGVGLTRSQAILAKTGVNPDIRVKDLEDGDLQKLRNAMEEYTLEGDLRRQEGMALKRLQDIGCVRGHGLVHGSGHGGRYRYCHRHCDVRFIGGDGNRNRCRSIGCEYRVVPCGAHVLVPG